MSAHQASLPTEEDVLEHPDTPEPTRGLVPRAGLFIAIGLFVLVLLGFAFYDLVIRQPAAHAVKTDKPQAKMAVDNGTPISPVTDIAELAKRQEAAAPVPPVAPASAPVMSPMVNPPAGVSAERQPIPVQGANGGAENQDQRASASMGASIFAISGEGADGGQGPLSAAAKGVVNDPTQKMIEMLEAKLQTAGTGGNSELEMIKAAVGGQGQSRPGKDQQWLKDSSAEQSAETTFAKQPASKWLVFQGTRVPVVVREAINSDLPGPVTAHVTSPVFDSIKQCGVLIPTGTRLIGGYSADIRPGQSRVLLGFTRMIFPDGRSLTLNGAQGVDQIGAAGIEGDVNNHWIKRFGYSFALGLISSSVSGSGPSSITVGQNGSSTTTTVAGQVLGDISRSILARDSNIPPTISLDVGSRLFVTMVRDLALQPVSTARCP